MPDENILKHGDTVSCSFGTSPGAFQSMQPSGKAQAGETIPLVNVPAFGMCSSMNDPMTLAATAAAQGVMTPSPCIPKVVGQWLGGDPTSANVSGFAMCHCTSGGVIKKL
ncbi:PAAR-like protein [Pelagibius sp. Alg239-R121]|uniref:PAAR-like protein n=1 Tax=Pelagibius sp. Alg239-R121 TaxID=2993448 RepID=UPI0024A72ABB|nr:PAAR-like protein [Pelagibius sp. Alg239-R121]